MLQNFAYFIFVLIKTLLWVLQAAMFVRALLSWFPGTEDSAFAGFVAMITEPFIIPIRALFERFGWFDGLPIDISFFVTYILLALLSTLLEVAM